MRFYWPKRTIFPIRFWTTSIHVKITEYEQKSLILVPPNIRWVWGETQKELFLGSYGIRIGTGPCWYCNGCHEPTATDSRKHIFPKYTFGFKKNPSEDASFDGWHWSLSLWLLAITKYCDSDFCEPLRHEADVHLHTYHV